MSQHALARETGAEVVKALPPVTLYALTLNEWLAVAGIFYIALQAAYLVWRWRRHARDGRVEAGDAP